MSENSWRPYEASDYLDVTDIDVFLNSAARDIPELFSFSQVGASRHGRPIWLVTLALGDKPLEERSILWLDAGTHASEWTGVSALMYSLSEWIKGVQQGDEGLLSWFEEHAILAIPCISPDGYQALRDGAPYLRSTLRPPRHDAPRRGLDPCDMDGDGVVRWMRWKHPAGPLVEDEDVPLYMRPRRLDDDPDKAYFMCQEGQFIDWDGASWTGADSLYGIDLNRNFPGNWKPFSMFGMDSGAYSASEPESRAVLDTFAQYPTIAAGLTYHTYTGCILTQPYSKDVPLQEDDLFLLQDLADNLVQDTGYVTYKVYPDFMYKEDSPTPGVWSDTMSTVFGVSSYTVEFWNPYKAAGVEVDQPARLFAEPDPDIIKALVKFAAGYETKSWEVVEHPQLGEVEIGGIDYLHTVRNPPRENLLGECRIGHNMAERLRHGLPRVRVNMESKALSGGGYLVSLLIENLGYLPTSSLHYAAKINASPGCRVVVRQEDGDAVIAAHSSSKALKEFDHLQGWGDRLRDGGRHALYPGLGSQPSRVCLEWIVESEGVFHADVFAGRAGHQSISMKLGQENQ